MMIYLPLPDGCADLTFMSMVCRPLPVAAGHPVRLCGGRLYACRASGRNAGYRRRLAQLHRKIRLTRRLLLGTSLRRRFPARDGGAADPWRCDFPYVDDPLLAR